MTRYKFLQAVLFATPTAQLPTRRTSSSPEHRDMLAHSETAPRPDVASFLKFLCTVVLSVRQRKLRAVWSKLGEAWGRRLAFLPAGAPQEMPQHMQDARLFEGFTKQLIRPAL